MPEVKQAPKAKKWYRYKVTHVHRHDSKKASVKVGDVLLYSQGRGRYWSEVVYNTKTGKVSEEWSLESIGPCWTEGDKIVRTVERKGK